MLVEDASLIINARPRIVRLSRVLDIVEALLWVKAVVLMKNATFHSLAEENGGGHIKLCADFMP